MLAGVSGASAPTTDVRFTPLNPAKKVLTNTSIGANLTRLVIVSGGSTTVPTNATTIQMTVTAKGSKAGTLSFYPNGNPSGTSGQTLSWAAGGTTTGTITTDIGQTNQVAFKNASAASTVVTATVTGYSTEVSAGDISGLGGTAGQTLVNNGAGGAVWKAPGRAWSWQNVLNYPLGSGYTSVAYVTVPAGSYLVSFTADVTGGNEHALVHCDLEGHVRLLHVRALTHHHFVVSYLANIRSVSSIVVLCRSTTTGTAVQISPTLIALEIGEANIS